MGEWWRDYNTSLVIYMNYGHSYGVVDQIGVCSVPKLNAISLQGYCPQILKAFWINFWDE